MEVATLAFWRESRAFEQLLQQNAGKPPFSFIDGPITANNPMGVHHAWGRTYKDVFQRYQAMLGHDQRYQNGFDCQGLWVEVEVEKQLGLNSKRDIEAYGMAEFARRCRERVCTYAGVQTEQSIRLGQWMRWDDSYYTMTDTNIEYIWHFLKQCQERGWLYRGARSMPWRSSVRWNPLFSIDRTSNSLYDEKVLDHNCLMGHRGGGRLVAIRKTSGSAHPFTVTGHSVFCRL